MSGTAVPFGSMIIPVMLFMFSGVALAKTWDSRKKKLQAFFMLVLTVVLFYGGYYFMTTGKTVGNLRNNAQARYANFQAARAARLGPTTNVPPPMAAPPPPMGAPMQ
jgi:hypothetical protein